MEGYRRQAAPSGECVEAHADPGRPERRAVLLREHPARVGPLGAPGQTFGELGLAPGLQRLRPVLVQADDPLGVGRAFESRSGAGSADKRFFSKLLSHYDVPPFASWLAGDMRVFSLRATSAETTASALGTWPWAVTSAMRGPGQSRRCREHRPRPSGQGSDFAPGARATACHRNGCHPIPCHRRTARRPRSTGL